MTHGEIEMVFDDLCKAQEYHDFYGAHTNMFKLGSTVFEAIEDENDGYRSYLDSLVVKESVSGFFSEPVAMVQIRERDEYNGDEGYELVDAVGHVWLTFGTNYADSYYPRFYFEYNPKER